MNRLKELRELRGYSQVELAKYLNIDRTTYNKYERVNSDPPSTTWIKLSEFYNVSVDYLLGLDDDRFILPDISADEKQLLAKLRALSPESIKSLNAFISWMENENKKEE